MPLYLPRGGDYERALEYMSRSRGIAGAMEGASQGMALVMNMQKIADNALKHEIREEEYAESRAKSAADLYAELDELKGGLGGVLGGEAAVGTGKRAKGGSRAAAAGAGGMGRDEAAALAEYFHTAAELRDLEEKAGGPIVRRPETVVDPRMRPEDVEGAVEADPGEPTSAEDMAAIQAASEGWSPSPRLMDHRSRLDASLAGQLEAQFQDEIRHLPRSEAEARIKQRLAEQMEEDRAAASGEERGTREQTARLTLPQEERSRLLEMAGAEGTDDQLSEAIARLGQDDVPLRRPYGQVTGPGGAPRMRPPEGIIGEGLINPAVSMGFSSRTVLDPVSQMYLAEMHRRGSGVPTSISNMLGVDRDKLFAPGAVGKTAEYQSELSGALRQFVGDAEEEDLAALTRVVTARLESAGFDKEVWTPEKIADLATDLASLSREDRESALEDIMSVPEHMREVERLKLKQRTYSTRINTGDPNDLLEELGRESRSITARVVQAEGKRVSAEEKLADKEGVYTEAQLAGFRRALEDADETLNGLKVRMNENERQRTIAYHKAYPWLGADAKPPPVKKVRSIPMSDASGLAETISDLTQRDEQREAGRDDALEFIRAVKRGGGAFESGAEEALLDLLPEAVEEDVGVPTRPRRRLGEKAERALGKTRAAKAKEERAEEVRKYADHVRRETEDAIDNAALRVASAIDDRNARELDAVRRELVGVVKKSDQAQSQLEEVTGKKADRWSTEASRLIKEIEASGLWSEWGWGVYR